MTALPTRSRGLFSKARAALCFVAIGVGLALVTGHVGDSIAGYLIGIGFGYPVLEGLSVAFLR